MKNKFMNRLSLSVIMKETWRVSKQIYLLTCLAYMCQSACAHMTLLRVFLAR